MALTDTKIKKLVPTQEYITAKKTKKYSDMNGLQLWVRYTGVNHGLLCITLTAGEPKRHWGNIPTLA